MTTFDLTEVRGFAADLDARMKQCDNGEGMWCANLDDSLKHYADLCCQFIDEVRRWGREVFAGRVAFDPEVEKVWIEGGRRLFLHARKMWARGRRDEDRCYRLDNQTQLESALWRLDRLLKGWVSPKLSVGPSARQRLAFDPAKVEEIRRRIASLPPLPADWQPDDPVQQALYRGWRNP